MNEKPNHVYQPSERKRINVEATYLALVTLLSVVFVVWAACRDFPQACEENTCPWSEIRLYFLVAGGGLLGGATYSIKWLYRAVARGIWYENRRLWRIFTPLVSGIVATALFALVDSGLLNLEVEGRTAKFAFAFGFLAGYFSDRAVGKLSDVATTLFGPVRDDGDG